MAARPLTVRLTAPTGQLNRELQQAGRAINRFARLNNRRFNRLAKTGAKTFRGVGRSARSGFRVAGRAARDFNKLTGKVVKGLGAVTAAAGLMAASSVKAFQDLDRGVREVATLIPGATQETVDLLRKETLILTKEFGFAGSEASKAYYDSLSAGVEQEHALGFLRDTAKLASAGNAELSASTDLMTSAVNAFRYETTQAGYVGDVFFNTVKMGKTTIDELGASFFQRRTHRLQPECGFGGNNGLAGAAYPVGKPPPLRPPPKSGPGW